MSLSSVLVTGGCGFVGCNLIRPLQEAGFDPVIVLDNESTGDRSHLDELEAVEFIKGDIRDPEIMMDVVSRADSIVHLAADTRVMDSIKDPSFNFDVNVAGTLNILDAMRHHGKRRIVSASTGGAILGDARPPVHEDMVPRPISPYGASKVAVEGYLSAYQGSYDLQPIALRFSNLYGPRSFHKGSVVAAFYKRILRGARLPVYGDGEQTRDLLYVGDLSQVIVDALKHEVTGVYQLGRGLPISVNELIVAISRVVGEDLTARVDHLEARRGEVRHNHCDVTRATRNLGFAATTDLETGLAATWDWFRLMWPGA